MEIMESSSTLNEEELLFDELEKAVVEYFESDEQRKRRNLLKVLRSNDCRETIVKCEDGDKISNAFVWAGYKNHSDILKCFLDRGMNVNIKDQDGDTALILTCNSGCISIVKKLLENHANPDVQK